MSLSDVTIVSIKNGLSVGLRPYNAIVDESFVMDAWVKNWSRTRDVVTWPRPTIDKHRKEVIETLVAGETTIIACHESNPAVLFGFICGRPLNTIHAVYVKDKFRQLGIADQMIRSLTRDTGWPTRCTHWSRKLETDGKLRKAFCEKYRVYYNPYYVRHCLNETP